MDKKSTPSFEDIANELTPSLTAYLKRMSRNAADADDLLQETLIRIARGLSQFEHKSSVKTWAFRIATNVTIDFFRKSKKFKFVEFNESDSSSEFEEDDLLILDEMNDCVRKVIDGLPPDYRAAIVLYNLHRKSIEETAQICNISIPTAKIRIHRAKARLKKALGNQCVFYKSDDGNLRCDKKPTD